jgi:hypothetical protein
MTSPEHAHDESIPMNRDHPRFIAEYVYPSLATDDIYRAPFPVSVFGVNKEFFGVGRLIGNIDENPVIEIEDKDSGKPVCIMGYESWWASPVHEEILELLVSGLLEIDSVAAYRQRQDDNRPFTEAGDQTFLDEFGIDPDSAS